MSPGVRLQSNACSRGSESSLVPAPARGWWQDTRATHADKQRSCCACSVLCRLKCMFWPIHVLHAELLRSQ